MVRIPLHKQIRVRRDSNLRAEEPNVEITLSGPDPNMCSFRVKARTKSLSVNFLRKVRRETNLEAEKSPDF
jgi:hypothetical protein